MDDLIKACNEAVYEFCGEHPDFKKRQIYNDINFMKSEAGWSAPIETYYDGKKGYYRYSEPFSINEKPLSEKEVTLLTEAISLLSRFRGMPQFDWMESLLANLQDKFSLCGNEENVIGFEQNVDYLAANYLQDLFMAIINHQVLHVNYRTFAGIDKEWILHPYFIKQYNNRWFLFGRNNEIQNKITNVPLDRIVSFKVVDVPYIENTDIDFNEYFDDIIGVTFPKEGKITEITLQFDEKRYPYIASKPIHGSMRFVDPENRIVEISVIPNRELEALILSYGDQVKVLAPEWYKKQISEKIQNSAKQYLPVHNECTDR